MFISIALPAHNAERYLPEAVESVLNQTHPDFELFIIDDGSVDRTLEIARDFEERDPRVRVVTHDNWGMGASLNHAIGLSNAEWIARLDADDLMEPDRLERQIAFIQDRPDVDVATTLVTYLSPAGTVIGYSQTILTSDHEFEEMKQQGLIVGVSHPSTLIRKSMFDRVGRYRGQFWPAEDLDLWIRIADAGGKVLAQPEYLTRYRVHSNSGSFGKVREIAVLMGWLKQCTANRRAGIPEPTRDEYLAQRHEMSRLRRLNDERKHFAYAVYRRATLSYSLGQYASMTFWLVFATAIGSRDVFRQLIGRGLMPALDRIRRVTGRRRFSRSTGAISGNLDSKHHVR